jgi:hypothetical protein
MELHEIAKFTNREDMKYTKQQTAFLNKINNLLTDYEPAILARVQYYHALIEERKQLTANNVLCTNDYEIEVSVQYYQYDGDGDPIHEYRTSKPTKEDSLLHSGEDWREGDFSPILDKPYCYLMHDLMYHGEYDRKEIFKIDSIWVDVKLLDQHMMKIKGEMNLD